MSHALLTRLPLTPKKKRVCVRLACVRPIASVHSEPGSNSCLFFLKKNKKGISVILFLFFVFFKCKYLIFLILFCVSLKKRDTLFSVLTIYSNKVSLGIRFFWYPLYVSFQRHTQKIRIRDTKSVSFKRRIPSLFLKGYVSLP